jgi:hypothetical protein
MVAVAGKDFVLVVSYHGIQLFKVSDHVVPHSGWQADLVEVERIVGFESAGCIVEQVGGILPWISCHRRVRLSSCR